MEMFARMLDTNLNFRRVLVVRRARLVIGRGCGAGCTKMTFNTMCVTNTGEGGLSTGCFPHFSWIQTENSDVIRPEIILASGENTNARFTASFVLCVVATIVTHHLTHTCLMAIITSHLI